MLLSMPEIMAQQLAEVSMRELSENILDIAQNSISANAKIVEINIVADEQQDIVYFEIIDDGCGMSEEFLRRVIDPFTTTRKTRKVGMGLPLLKSLTEMAGGKFEIASEVGKGTKVYSSFAFSHIDRLPLGDIVGTYMVLLNTERDIDFIFSITVNQKNYTFDTREVKEVLGGIKICEAEVLQILKKDIEENISQILGGINL